MEPAALDARLRAARAATLEAAALARRHFADLGSLRVEAKGPQDLVSEADRAVEAGLRAALLGAFPGDGFLGEESGGADAPVLWVVDPIDGTTNFLRGIDAFGVSVALLVDGSTELGLIARPSTGALWWARRGAGAFEETASGATRRLAVRAPASMRDGLVGLGFSGRAHRGDALAVIDRLLAAGAEFRRPGAGTLALADVARGALDAFWHPSTRAWDVLAGLLLVTEAGGRASALDPAEGLLGAHAVLAAAPGVADAMTALTGVPLGQEARDRART